MRSIKRYRAARGITQVEMAARFGISQATVANWESENGYPPGRVMLALAEYLGCTTDELYADDRKEVS